MKASDYICDICGIGIREDDTFKCGQFKLKKNRCLEFAGNPYALSYEFSYDLCPDCARMLKDRMYEEIKFMKQVRKEQLEFFKDTSKED